MSYQIKFRSRELPDISVSTERGENLKALWFDENNKNKPVDIDGNAYQVGDIKSIIKVPDPIKPSYTQTALPQGKKCQGQYSIQKEINQIAQDVGSKEGPQNPDGLPWSKLITDKSWRELIRKELRSDPKIKWCDSKVSECVCD